MVPVSFSLVAFVAFVAFVDLRSRLLTLDHLRTSSHGARSIAALTSSRLLTLGIAQTRLALRSLNRSLAFTSRCHIDGKSTLLPSEAACDRWVSHQNGTTALGSP